MKLSLLSFLIFICLNAAAQTSVTGGKGIGLGAEFGIASTSIFSIRLGISGKGELPLAGPVSLTITAGYDAFFYKSNLFGNSRTPAAAQYLPIKAGIRYYFSKGVYAEGEAGTVIELNYLKQNLFVYSAGPGFQVPLSGSNSLDIGFRYESWSHNQVRQAAIRVAYRFAR